MNYSSTLEEVSTESSFRWTINNLQKLNWKKGFTLKSKEIVCKEANIRWHLKLIPFIYDNDKKVFISTKFFVKQLVIDENANYNFSITLNENLGKVASENGIEGTNKNPNAIKMESSMMAMKAENGNFSYEMCRFFALGENDEKIELTPKITIETLKYDYENETAEQKEEEEEELEDTLTDEATTEEDTSQSDVSESSCSCEVNEKPIPKMSDTELAEKISDIYLQKMRQVADTSGRLMVSAARVSFFYLFYCDLLKNEGKKSWKFHKTQILPPFHSQNKLSDLLDDCTNSLAGQITVKNFFDIWEIAIKLNLPELKQKVITFFAANRSKVHYDSKISPEFMLSYVKAMD